MAGFILQFFRITAGSLQDLDDLFVRIMHGLPGTRAVIEEGTDSLLRTGRVFLGNFLQEREPFDKAAPPFTDRILPKTCLF